MENRRRVLIYGIKMQAQQLRYYIENESCAKVAAFVVDREFQTVTALDGLPVLTFEEAVEQYPPASCSFAVSFAYQHMVRDRQEKIEKCKAAGYGLLTFVSKYANCFAAAIGEGTIIYPGCNIAYGVSIGEGCYFETGCTVAHHTTIGNFNFFAPTVTLCGGITTGNNNFFGSNCTVMNNAVIGSHVLIGAGAVVRHAEDDSVWLPPKSVEWHGKSFEMKI